MVVGKVVRSLKSYTFNYVVDAAGVLSQHLQKKKSDVIEGQYSFLQPDGKVRIVYYKADDRRGFQAVVKYRTSGPPMGHLRYPRDFLHPVQFAEPVAFVVDHKTSHQHKKFKHR